MEIISFYTSVPKIMIICYTVPEIWHVKISKKNLKCLEMSSFYTSIPKIMIIWYTVLEIWCMTDVIVIFILGYFLSFYPTNLPEK